MIAETHHVVVRETRGESSDRVDSLAIVARWSHHRSGMRFERWSEQHAAAVAWQFTESDAAGMWSLFGPTIRRALLDSYIMDHLRIADAVDSRATLTATQIVAFRSLVEAMLATGIRRPSRAAIAHFTVEEG